MRRFFAALVLAAVAVLAVVGISTATGSGTAHSAATTLSLKASASGALKFNKKSLSARRGRVTIVMTNPSGSGLTHGIAVEGKGVDKDGRKVRPGKKSTVSVSLKKGRYTFYCPVDGHKAAGMRGTLTVK
jgi:plastocyanin